MATEADIADEVIEVEVSLRLAVVHRQLELMPKGKAGECLKCGEEMPRLVYRICCRCRDKLHLP